jgi:hypothetical protein
MTSEAEPQKVWLLQRVLRFQFGAQQAFPVQFYTTKEAAEGQRDKLDAVIQDTTGHNIQHSPMNVGQLLLAVGLVAIEHAVFETVLHVEESKILT